MINLPRPSGGVFYIEGTAAKSNRIEKIYYIRYRKDGKLVEEKAGRQYQDDMTCQVLKYVDTKIVTTSHQFSQNKSLQACHS
ncbi:MAG: hypothetical protein D3908_14675 [Candidatus Electrothrix sp. AUS4]|nr:hypothetical protein [Candidatus Electrothrix sp. AUS4]